MDYDPRTRTAQFNGNALPGLQALKEFLGGGTGGDRPTLSEEKSRDVYSMETKGWNKEIARAAQIMSIFGVSSWMSAFFSAVFAPLTT